MVRRSQHRYQPSNPCLRFLRDELGLMGTKDGCSNGHCGACSVIIDGKLTRSCLVKVIRLDGANILTIEGLAANGELGPDPAGLHRRRSRSMWVLHCRHDHVCQGIAGCQSQSGCGGNKETPDSKPQSLPLHGICQYHQGHPTGCRTPRRHSPGMKQIPPNGRTAASHHG